MSGTQQCMLEVIKMETLEAYVKSKLLDTIKSRGLMTKRNKTSSVISREWIIMLRKTHNQL